MKEYFQSIAQAFFLDRALFGVGLLGLVLTLDPQAFLAALYCSLVGFAHSISYSTPKVLKQFGLLTINGFFFGLAMSHIFEPSTSFYICVLVGSFGLPFFVKASYEVLQHWKLSPFIFPYIVLVWLFYLSAPGLSLVENTKAWPIIHTPLAGLHLVWPLWLRLLDATFLSTGRLLFLPDAAFGMAVILMLFVFSFRRAVYFLVGTGSALMIAYLLSGESFAWEYGYFSYSAGLVGLGLASFPQRHSWRTILIFCCFSCFITIASDRFLANLALPILSLPYVLTMWLAVLSRVPRINLSWAPDQRGTLASIRTIETPVRKESNEKAA